jgi:hypothetical protein
MTRTLAAELKPDDWALFTRWVAALGRGHRSCDTPKEMWGAARFIVRRGLSDGLDADCVFNELCQLAADLYMAPERYRYGRGADLVTAAGRALHASLLRAPAAWTPSAWSRSCSPRSSRV